MVVMGPMLLEKLKRLPKANPHFIQHLQVCYAECQRISPAGWGATLPGAVSVPEAAVAQKANPSNGYGRSELQILVDNVIRDLPSVEKHTALLVAYMDKHPHDHGKLDQYLETVPLASIVRDFMEDHRVNRLKSHGPVTEQICVSAAQSLFTLRSRFEAMRRGRDPMSLSASMISSSINPVLQARDTNADSFSEPSIPVPESLNETKAKLTSINPTKKRRTMDSAALNSIQSRLAGIGND